MATMDNQFSDTSGELMTLDTHDCLDGAAVHTLFSQLFVAAQVRDKKLEDFFPHENHPWPPAWAT